MKFNFSSSLSVGFTSVREHPHNFDAEANPIYGNFNWMENLSMQLFTLLDKSKISFYLLCNNK